MRYLLCGINAKYIHTNPAILSLKAYAESRYKSAPGADSPERAADTAITKQDVSGVRTVPEILIREYTINHYVEDILQDIFQVEADVVIFSCYIWNIRHVIELAAELKKVTPHTAIWAGGPEVSYDGKRFLGDHSPFDLVMRGEGEEVFCQLTLAYDGSPESIPSIPGLVTRRDGLICDYGMASPVDLDSIPFIYDDFGQYTHKILYYESSRGCPFGCSYCLSSVNEKVRFRSLPLVKRELDIFLEARVSQVKFVDRTFNCDKRRTREIWRHLTAHDNGVTNFHFEISADLLDDESLEIFSGMRPGLIQLEIGVQSTCPETLEAINRRMDLDLLFHRVDQVRAMGNIHQHLDLIAGLPYEDYERFSRSFDDVYALRPDQLQLGFLKVLKGTRMLTEAEKYEIRYRDHSPYEVLSTGWLSYRDVIALKGIEEMVEMYYNSGQYRHTLEYVVPFFGSPFRFYENFSRYYRGLGLHKLNHNRLEKYEILRDFLKGQETGYPLLDEIMLYDLYLRENVKSRPSWAPDPSPWKKERKELYRTRRDLLFSHVAEEEYDSRRAANRSHLERFSFDIVTFIREGVCHAGTYECLFDYDRRNPLNQDARTVCILIPDP